MEPGPKSGSRSRNSTRSAPPKNCCPGRGRVGLEEDQRVDELPGHGPAPFYTHTLFMCFLTRANMVLDSGLEQFESGG